MQITVKDKCKLEYLPACGESIHRTFRFNRFLHWLVVLARTHRVLDVRVGVLRERAWLFGLRHETSTRIVWTSVPPTRKNNKVN